jgi:hypothetical protein
MIKIEGVIKPFGEKLFYGHIPQIKGLVVQGISIEETLKELLLSLRVKLAFDFGLDMSKIIAGEERDIAELIKNMNSDSVDESRFELATI